MLARRLAYSLVVLLITAACSDPELDAVAELRLLPAELELQVGATGPLELQALSKDGESRPLPAVSFSSSDPNVAIVEGGRVRGLAVGYTVIAARSGELRAETGVRVVAARPVELAVQPPSVDLVEGERRRLVAKAWSEERLEVPLFSIAWSVEDPLVASVDVWGELVGLRAGVTAVRAEAEGLTATAIVRVVEKPVERIVLSPESLHLYVGGEDRIEARLEDREGGTLEGRTVAWTSLDESVAVVDGEGIVRGVSPGQTTLRARSGDAESEAEIVVRHAVAKVRIELDAAPLRIGESVLLRAIAYSAGGEELSGRRVEWSSDASSVLSVDEEGVAIALSPGKAIVTAVVEGATAARELEVLAPVEAVRLTPAIDEILLRQEVALTAQALDTNGNVLVGRSVSWSSSDPEVIAVDDEGRIVAHAMGEAEVRATIEGVKGTSSLRVRSLAFVSLAGGGATNCGLTAEGEAWCWGYLPWLQEGSAVPRRLPSELPVEQVVVGLEHLCFLDSSGAARCVGKNTSGQLGDGTYAYADSPVAVLGDRVFRTLVAGGASTCGLTAADELYCWGDNSSGHFGTGDTQGSAVPIRAFPGLHLESFAQTQSERSTQNAACGITAELDIYCAGHGGHGLFGNGEAGDSSLPVAAAGGLTLEEIQLVSRSLTHEALGHACGRTAAGEVFCWGNDELLGSPSVPESPQPLAGAHEYLALAATPGASCGLRTDGRVLCWGSGSSGALGRCPSFGEHPPAEIDAPGRFTAVVSSPLRPSSCALAENGHVRCWGVNGFGALGRGRITAWACDPAPVVGTVP